jgi:effector-binding domain-containing protein/uncharacterized coiled-coil protein SlyX
VKTQFQIGEMAAINHTTIKTLRYYDQIGLFKPRYVDPHTGYRYYEAEQFERLNTIQYLKTMGLSLREIQVHLDNRSIDDFQELLANQEAEIDRQIRTLQSVKHRFKHRIEDLEIGRHHPPLGHPQLEMVPERRVIRLDQVIRTNDELEVALRQLENQAELQSVIFIGGVGLVIEQHELAQHRFDEYHGIFVLVDETTTSPLVATIPAGCYASIYHNGNHTQSAQYYDQLLHYVADQRKAVSGDAIERTIIDQYVSRNPQDYLTKIEIPIKN